MHRYVKSKPLVMKLLEEWGGMVEESQTPEPEVRGSKPNFSVLCP